MPTISYKDDAEGFTILVNEIPIDSRRLADGTYHVAVFPYQTFKTPQAAIKLLQDTYGVLWSDAEGEL